ncbi:MAG: hypothetical protein JNJ47_02740 [Alphaproteobacteria bacterium]|nr:hypothetical protein [Alphaproteobacteria bacterium]
MSASVKMRQLQSKISDLQTQYQYLLPQRQEDIATLITSLDLASMEDAFLVGGLLFVKDKVTTQDPIAEDWQSAGEKFLRQAKSKNNAPSKRPTKPHSAHQSS